MKRYVRNNSWIDEDGAFKSHTIGSTLDDVFYDDCNRNPQAFLDHINSVYFWENNGQWILHNIPEISSRKDFIDLARHYLKYGQGIEVQI